jgi:hypothetical protein
MNDRKHLTAAEVDKLIAASGRRFRSTSRRQEPTA